MNGYHSTVPTEWRTERCLHQSTGKRIQSFFIPVVSSLCAGTRFGLASFILLVVTLESRPKLHACMFETEGTSQREPLVDLMQQLQMKMVKVYGAGGIRGLESYQSGFFVSDQGHVLTSWSTVLDVEKIRVVTYDGKKWEGEVIGSDPITELAILKIEGDGFPFFRIDEGGKIQVGDRVFGLSNLFGIATGNEASSVQRGSIMARSTLAARRGRMKTPYQGPIWIIDVMTNNPGANGGALVDLRGHLVGVLGKELRDDQSGIWINYALPMETVSESARNILEGKTIKKPAEVVAAKRPHRTADLGIILIPDVLPKTPAYIDQVGSKSLAGRSGLAANDLVLAVNGQRVDSRSSLEQILSTIDRADPVSLLIQRNDKLMTIEIRP